MPAVTLCMIVRNEEHQLADCLAPVAGLFSEIVVVDTGSQDGTREVARRFTSQVHDFVWCDDFSAARNRSLEQATGEWAFWLDADDRVTDSSVAKLKRLLSKLGDNQQVYWMDTICQSCDVGSAPWLITHQRLFRRHPQLRWAGRVHEQLRPCPSMLDYQFVHSDVEIAHVGYTDAAQRHKKLQRDLRLLRMDYAVDPQDPSTLLHLGLAQAELGCQHEAQQLLMRVLDLQDRPLDYMRRAFNALAEMEFFASNFQAALKILQHARQVFPDDLHLMYLQAEVLYELNCYAEAQALLTAIIHAAPAKSYHAGTPHELRQKLAPRCLGEVLRVQRQLKAAEEVLRSVLAQYPDDTLTWHALGRVYIDLANGRQLAEVCERLLGCPQGDVFRGLLEAGWKLTRREYAGIDDVLARLVALAPTMPLPRLMRVQWLAQSQAPAQEQVKACRDVLRLQPSNPYAAGILAQFERRGATGPFLRQSPSSDSLSSAQSHRLDLATSVALVGAVGS